ncbi:MAG TPA: MFS transporter, partial [Terriglobales bacterium]|nr:MFS transporter [Terriglobales bacterium]
MDDAPKSKLALIAFTYPDFTRYQFARFVIVAALEMQAVAVGWQIYEITKRPLDLGLAGLAQFLPGILLFLLSGHAADRLDRRKLLLACYAGFAVCSGLLLFIARRGTASVLPIYLVLLTLGAVRAFNGPVSRAFLPQLVPEEHFPNAVTWNATTWQAATILGPSLGGFLYAIAHGPTVVYAGAMAASGFAFMVTTRMRPKIKARPREEVNLKTVFAGFSYIWRKKIVLGSISLDMFAVLLGGSVALLPVYAREILHTGPWALGVLRSAPGVGAAVMAIYLAHYPLRRRVGLTMLWCVAGFGVFTILFGISHLLILSLAALFMTGAFDMVSVIIRGT